MVKCQFCGKEFNDELNEFTYEDKACPSCREVLEFCDNCSEYTDELLSYKGRKLCSSCHSAEMMLETEESELRNFYRRQGVKYRG
jgi:phage FluMu protein Com